MHLVRYLSWCSLNCLVWHFSIWPWFEQRGELVKLGSVRRGYDLRIKVPVGNSSTRQVLWYLARLIFTQANVTVVRNSSLQVEIFEFLELIEKLWPRSFRPAAAIICMRRWHPWNRTGYSRTFLDLLSWFLHVPGRLVNTYNRRILSVNRTRALLNTRKPRWPRGLSV